MRTSSLVLPLLFVLSTLACDSVTPELDTSNCNESNSDCTTKGAGGETSLDEARRDAEGRCAARTPDTCDEVCVNQENDPKHCGACGEHCAQGKLCSQGTCGDSCSPEEDECGGLCVQTDTDVENCGGCGVACASNEVCVTGKCTNSCPSNAPVACDTLCKNLWIDPENCGGCGVPCARTEVCSEGICADFCAGSVPTLCGDACRNLLTDPNACGSCEHRCEENEVCSNGACISECENGTACEGECVDTKGDPRHCGGCGKQCVTGAVCADGLCADECQKGATACGGTCVDLKRSGNHCGECNNTCGDGLQCKGGSCVCDAPGESVCEGHCVDASSDHENCGACGNACSEEQLCALGTCRDHLEEVVAGWTATCMRSFDHEVRCFGSGSYQTGEDGYSSSTVINTIQGIAGPINDLEVGGNHACVLLDNGKVQCWGNNDLGLLGYSGPSTKGAVFSELDPLRTVVRLEVGFNHGAVIYDDGSLATFGYNPSGELGHGGTLPAPVEGLVGTVVDVQSGSEHLCARLSRNDGAKVFCWGQQSAIFSDGSFTGIGPTEVTGLEIPDVGVNLETALAVGTSITCAIVGAGKVACFGANPHGEFGVPNAELPSSATPVLVPGLPGRAKEIQLNQMHVCARLESDELYCWGQGIGNGQSGTTSTPTKIIENVEKFSLCPSQLAFVKPAGGQFMSWGGGVASGRVFGNPLVPEPCCDQFW